VTLSGDIKGKISPLQDCGFAETVWIAAVNSRELTRRADETP